MIANHAQAKRAFFESAERGALEAPYCNDCSEYYFYPRAFCPRCWSEDVEYRAVSGFGTIWSHTIVRFAHGAAQSWPVPYVVALVTLDEGIRLMGNVVDCPFDSVHAKMRVAIAYRQIGDRVLPVWTPA